MIVLMHTVLKSTTKYHSAPQDTMGTRSTSWAGYNIPITDMFLWPAAVFNYLIFVQIERSEYGHGVERWQDMGEELNIYERQLIFKWTVLVNLQWCHCQVRLISVFFYVNLHSGLFLNSILIPACQSGFWCPPFYKL